MIDLGAIVAEVTGQRPVAPRSASRQLDLVDFIASVTERPQRLAELPDPPDATTTYAAWVEQLGRLVPDDWRVQKDAKAAWKADLEGRRPVHTTSEYLARMSFYRRVRGGDDLIYGDILQVDLLTAPIGHEPYFYHQDPAPIIGPGGRRVESWTPYRYALVGARSDPGRWRTYRIWVGHHVRDVLGAALRDIMVPVALGEPSTRRWPLGQ